MMHMDFLSGQSIVEMHVTTKKTKEMHVVLWLDGGSSGEVGPCTHVNLSLFLETPCKCTIN